MIAPLTILCDDQKQAQSFNKLTGAPISDDEIYDLTKIMERFVDEDMEQINIMAELLTRAEAANLNSGYNKFRIGDGIYTLEKLKEIQKLEEQDALFKQSQ